MIKLKNILNEQISSNSNSDKTNFPGLREAMETFAKTDLNTKLKNTSIMTARSSYHVITSVDETIQVFWSYDDAINAGIKFDYSNVGGLAGGGPLYRKPIGPIAFYLNLKGTTDLGKIEIYFLNYKPYRIGEASIFDKNYSEFSDATKERILASIKDLSFEKYIPTLPIIKEISSTLKLAKPTLKWIVNKTAYNTCFWKAKQGNLQYDISFQPDLYTDKSGRAVIDICISDITKGDCTKLKTKISLNTSLDNAMKNLTKAIVNI